MPRLTISERNQIIGMLNSNVNFSIISIFDCSVETIRRIKSKYDQYGSVEDLPRSGRPSVTTEKEKRRIVRGAGTFRHQPFGRQKLLPISATIMSPKCHVKCVHIPSSALNAGAKRSGATCHMAMPQCCYLAKGAKRPSHTTNMLISLNISVI